MDNKIEPMLEGAWKKFCDYYDTKAPQYRNLWSPQLDKKGANTSHWICWNEYDLMFYTGRFFYDILGGGKKEFSNIEIHFEKTVSLTNFKDYTFANKLKTLKKRLKRWPKVDMIVAYENSNEPFLLCAEVKNFRYQNHYDKKSPIEKINDDIKKLKAIKELNIAQRVVFILFDDYYWLNDKRVAQQIQQRLKQIEKDGIKVLSHTSKAKLEEMNEQKEMFCQVK